MSKKAKKVRALKKVYTAKTRAEVEEYIAQIGKMERNILDLEADFQAELRRHEEEIEALRSETAQAIETQIKPTILLVNGVEKYCQANNLAINKDGTLTSVDFSSGTVSRRWGNWKVKLETSVEVAIQNIKKAHLKKRFLQTKVEIKKQAMREDPNSRELANRIDGIKVERDQYFVIKPNSINIDVSKRYLQDVRRLFAKKGSKKPKAKKK